MTTMTADMADFSSGSPVQFDVQYPESLSRWLIFVKWLLAIPHFLILYALSIVSALITFIAFFAILFTTRYPEGMFKFAVGIARWQANVSAYVSLLRDEYPPFSFDAGQYPVVFDIAYPGTLSRWMIFVKWLLVIPNAIVYLALLIASWVTTMIAWFAILFTGSYPRALFDFAVGVQRWGTRANAYSNLMTDNYPPFSLK